MTASFDNDPNVDLSEGSPDTVNDTFESSDSDGSTTDSKDSSLAVSGSQEEGGQNSGNNPAWSEFLGALPSSLHSLAKPHLEKWDQSYRSLQDQYAPFKDIPENFRDANRLTQAIQVFDQIGQDPYRVLSLLAENLGVTIQEAGQIVENQQAEGQQVSQDNQDDSEQQGMDFNEEDDPRLQQLWERNQQLEQQMNERFQYLEQLEQQKIQEQTEAQFGSEIDTKVRSLLDAKKVDPSDLPDLMEFAANASQAGSKDPIMDAYKRLQGNIERISKRIQPKSDPLLFMPTDGAAPPNTGTGPDKSTAEGRYAIAKQIAEAAARQ